MKALLVIMCKYLEQLIVCKYLEQLQIRVPEKGSLQHWKAKYMVKRVGRKVV